MEIVASINQYEDLYFSKGGGLEASLRLQAKMSRVMTFQDSGNRMGIR